MSASRTRGTSVTALRAVWCATISIVAGACLGSPPSDPVRWFDPVPAELVFAAEASAATDADAAARALRISSVEAAPHLSRTLSWRVADTELVRDEPNRWVAAPEALVRETLERSLFESERFRSRDSLDAPTLVVRVRAFEGVIGASGEARAVVELSCRLSSRRGTAAAATVVENSEPLGSNAADALAAGMRAALAGAAAEVASWAVGQLESGS